MQRLVGLGLVILQAALMGLLARTVSFPLFVVLFASVGVFTKWRVSLSREQAFLISAGAAFFFLIKHRISPHEFPLGAEFIRTHLAFMIAQFLLLIEAAQFLIRHEDDLLPPVLPALGAVAMVCIADIQITEPQRTMTQVFAILYPMLWALFLWVGRRPMAVPPAGESEQEGRRARAGRRRQFSAAIVLTLAAASAWISSLGLYQFERKIENWLVRMMSGANRESRVGFSRNSQLGSVVHKKTEAEEKIALRAYSEKFPGYLRGAVYFRFESDMWIAERPIRMPPPLADAARPEGMRQLAENEFLHAHPLVEFSGEKWRYLECWLPEDHDAAFTPLGASHLVMATDRVIILPYGVFSLADFEDSNPYIACVPEQFDYPDLLAANGVSWRQIPEEYREALSDLAKEVFDRNMSDREKVEAVERYFHANYGYSLSIEIPRGEDPLLFFLREKPAAHCEYFCHGGGALAADRGGSPARYATGFVPAEWNPSGKFWAARNRDAHAWVEAYVEPDGWVIVEATPGEGVPSTDQPTTGWAWWDAIRSDWQRLRTYLAQNRWDRVRAVLSGGLLGVFAGLFALAFAVYLAVRIPWRRPFGRRRKKTLEPGLAEMQGLLETMDRQLKPHGLERLTGETLHQFARRVREWEQWPLPRKASGAPQAGEFSAFALRAAEWYRDFADSRYQGLWDDGTLSKLKSRLPQLPATHP